MIHAGFRCDTDFINVGFALVGRDISVEALSISRQFKHGPNRFTGAKRGLVIGEF